MIDGWTIGYLIFSSAVCLGGLWLVWRSRLGTQPIQEQLSDLTKEEKDLREFARRKAMAEDAPKKRDKVILLDSARVAKRLRDASKK